MKIIDAHNHIDFHGFSVGKAVENMDRHGISQAWLLSWEAPEDEIDQTMYRRAFHPDLNCLPFLRISEALKEYPDRFIGGYCPDPRSIGALEKLEVAYHSYHVKVCGELKVRMVYDSPDGIELFRFCGRYHLPVVLHIDYPIGTGNGSNFPRGNYWYGGGIEALERLLRKVPETIFIGHAPGFWSHISADDLFASFIYPKGPVLQKGKIVQLFEDYENLYADLSAESALNALQRDLGFTKEFLDRFQDRLLFARDCYSSDLYNFLEALPLSDSIREKIYWKNAEKLLSIGEGKMG